MPAALTFDSIRALTGIVEQASDSERAPFPALPSEAGLVPTYAAERFCDRAVTNDCANRSAATLGGILASLAKSST